MIEFRESSNGQLSVDPKVVPRELIESVVEEYAPAKSFCLVSGGNDSTAALLVSKDYIDAAVFIDTGTSLPGVEDHARSVAESCGVDFLVYRAPEGEFDRMVLDHGFPGPAQHRIAYIRLKERQVERLVREHKTKWSDKIMLVTGVRRQESVRRMGTTETVRRRGAQLWVAPIIDLSKKECREMRIAAGIGESEVASLTHRSGECNCGAYAQPGEREMLKSLYGSWFESRIAPLEREAEARGHGPLAVWGHCMRRGESTGPVGPMCEGCES